MLDITYEGFGQDNQQTMEALNKALSAGSGVDTAVFTGGRALIPESLDTTLVNILWDQDEAKLFKALKKNSVKGPVHQWNKRTGVGSSDGAWVAEGGDSQEADQDIARAYVTMKYLQTLRKATLQAQISNTTEGAIAIEKNAGTLWIIQQVEKTLFHGNQSVVTEEPDGLDTLISTNIIDIRGADATSATFEKKITEAARKIRSYYGMATNMFGSLIVMEDVQELLKDRIRFGTGKTEANSVWEYYPTPFGKPKIEDNVFIQEGATPVASTLTALRPSQVTIALVRQAATGSRVSKFIAADAGSYWYQVCAVNKYGYSQASTAVQISGVVAGDEVEITITDGSTVGTGYAIFRSQKDAATGADCRECFKIAKAAAVIKYDINADLPGTSSLYVLNLRGIDNAIEWEQFLPLMKFDLFPTNAAVIPFLMILFGALGLKKEEHMARIKNIAPSTLSWF